MKEDIFAKERVQMLLKKEMLKGDPGDTPIKGKHYFTTEEKREFIDAIQSRITLPKDGKNGKDAEVDYNLVFNYVQSKVADFVNKIKLPKDGKNGKDAVVSKEMMTNLVKDVIKSLPEKKYVIDRKQIENLIKTHVESVRQQPRQFLGSVASLKNILDVDLSNLTQDAQGNYILGGGSSVSDEAYSGSWNGVTDEGASKNAIYDAISGLGGGHDPVTVTDSSEIDFTLTEQDITASIIAGSIDETKLDTSTNASLDLADSATQPGDLATVATTGDYDDLTNKPSASAGHTVEDEGTPLTARTKLNFVGAGVTVTDDSGDDATVVTIPSGGAGVSDGDKGDITVSSSGATWTVDDEAVTLTKMAHIATDSFLGRDTASTGDVEVLSASTARGILNVEDGATADQTDSEIETAYNNQVSQVSGGEKTAGTETDVRRFSPDDVKDMIDTHGGGIPFTTGAGAPASAPTSAPSIYLDTTNDTYYFATDTSSVDDWDISLTGGALTKGSILVSNGTSLIEVGVGSNTHVLTVDSAEATGVKWAAQTGGSGTVTNGAGAPGSAPSTLNDIYHDTTNKRVYHAFGTSATSDWRYTETTASA